VGAAQDLLRDAGTSAVALVAAAESLIGDGFLLWEPDTIWHSIDVDVPQENRDKLMASVALHLVPSFYWDAVVFEKTAVAFAGKRVLPEVLQEATPADLAWAVVEAKMIRENLGDESLDFEHEPTAYAAVALERAGFVLAPEQLQFAQPLLERRLPKSGLLAETRGRWTALEGRGLEDLDLRETPLDVQIAHLAAVELHVRERRARARDELARTS
jgi:hypothetical protein